MILSDQQTAAVNHGRQHKKTFRLIELPVGPQDLPAWALGVRINWMDGWDNSPEIQLKIAYDPLHPGGYNEDKLPAIFHRVDDRTWLARSEGMASVHYHSGDVSLVPFIERTGFVNGKGYDKDIQSVLDGEPYFEKGVPSWPGSPEAKGEPKMGGFIFKTVMRPATTQQEGYAGRAFPVRMAPDSDIFPGEVVRLRGPWHGGAPKGFDLVEVHCLVWDEETRKRHISSQRWARITKRSHRWWNNTLSFGWYVERDVLLKILARFVPHIQWAMVNESYGWRLQPCRPETGLPKGFYVPADECPGHVVAKFPGHCNFCHTWLMDEDARKRMEAEIKRLSSPPCRGFEEVIARNQRLLDIDAAAGLRTLRTNRDA